MQLTTYNNKDRWVEIHEDFKVKVDYPNINQKYILEEMQFKGFDGENTKNINLASFNQSARFYIKFTIKDWEGLKDFNGDPIPCLTVNNELEDSLWSALVANDELTFLMYKKIDEVLRWNYLDKKK
jgi:hypothetical protein